MESLLSLWEEADLFLFCFSLFLIFFEELLEAIECLFELDLAFYKSSVLGSKNWLLMTSFVLVDLMTFVSYFIFCEQINYSDD